MGSISLQCVKWRTISFHLPYLHYQNTSNRYLLNHSIVHANFIYFSDAPNYELHGIRQQVVALLSLAHKTKVTMFKSISLRIQKIWGSSISILDQIILVRAIKGEETGILLNSSFYQRLCTRRKRFFTNPTGNVTHDLRINTRHNLFSFQISAKKVQNFHREGVQNIYTNTHTYIQVKIY